METSFGVVLATVFNHPKPNNHKWKTPYPQKKNERKLERKKIENHHQETTGTAASNWEGWCGWLKPTVAPPPNVGYMLKAKTLDEKGKGC